MNFVECKSCGKSHYTKNLQIENIEEGPIGEDIITYICPITGDTMKAVVYYKR